MNRVEELIQQLCPNGVEWKKLIDVAFVQYGYPFNAKLFSDDISLIPIIRIRDINSGKSSTYYNGEILSDYIIRKGDILLGMDGNFNLEKWNDRDALLNQRVCKIKSKDSNKLVLNDYLYHLLKPLFKNIEEEIKGGTVKHLSANRINSIEIPIPPLPIQQEIVRILDTFTELNTNLQTELEARKKQYAYYRDCLLNFEGVKGVEWKKLGEIFEIRNGYTPSKANKEYWENGTIPWFRMEDIRENGHILAESIQYVNIKGIKSGKLFPANSIILATTATIGEHALILKDYLANQRFSCLVRKPEFIPLLDIKFVFYYMFTIDEWCKNNTNISGFASVDMDKLRKKMFPIPPLSEQRRIVSILDQFETLVNDLSIGLPAELEARRKQYEYYRDKLLTFDRV